MASQGPNSPGTVTTDPFSGTVDWSNPSNITSSNNIRATANLGSFQISYALVASNFGFSIPSGATIDGIVVEIEKQAGTANRLIDNGVWLDGITGAFSESKAIGSFWSTTEQYITYGGATDLWTASPTANEINSSAFAVYFDVFGDNTAQARVDHIRVTVYYTEGAPPPSSTPKGVFSNPFSGPFGGPLG